MKYWSSFHLAFFPYQCPARGAGEDLILNIIGQPHATAERMKAMQDTQGKSRGRMRRHPSPQKPSKAPSEMAGFYLAMHLQSEQQSIFEGGGLIKRQPISNRWLVRR